MFAYNLDTTSFVAYQHCTDKMGGFCFLHGVLGGYRERHFHRISTYTSRRLSLEVMLS